MKHLSIISFVFYYSCLSPTWALHIPWTPIPQREFDGLKQPDWRFSAKCAVASNLPAPCCPLSLVDLRLLDHPDLELPEPDPEFSAGLLELLGDKADRYGVAVLDLSDPDHPRLAEHRGDFKQNVGSVGKIAVAVAVFQALADMYPDDIEARIAAAS